MIVLGWISITIILSPKHVLCILHNLLEEGEIGKCLTVLMRDRFAVVEYFSTPPVYGFKIATKPPLADIANKFLYVFFKRCASVMSYLDYALRQAVIATPACHIFFPFVNGIKTLFVAAAMRHIPGWFPCVCGSTKRFHKRAINSE